MPGSVAVNDAARGRLDVPRAVLEPVQNASVPTLSGIDSDFEAEPPIGIECRAGGSHRGNGERPGEIAVAIGGTELLPGRLPLRHDASAADNPVCFDLEDVGKIAAGCDLELELDRLFAVVGDIEI